MADPMQEALDRLNAQAVAGAPAVTAAQAELAQLIPAINNLADRINQAAAAGSHTVNGAPLWDAQSAHLAMMNRARELRGYRLEEPGAPAFAHAAQAQDVGQDQAGGDQARQAAQRAKFAREAARARAEGEREAAALARQYTQEDAAADAQRTAALLQTPQGQGGAALAAARAQAQQLQAQATYAETPQGQQQLQAQQQAQGQAQQAQARIARAQQIAQHGRLSVAVSDTAAAFSRLNPAIAAVKKGLDFVMDAAAHASPNAQAVYQGSINLLKAQIGTPFVPGMNQASELIQRLGDAVETTVNYVRPQPGGGGNLIQRAGRFAFDHVSPLMDAATAATGGTGKPKLNSLQGLPPAQIGTAESHYDRMMMASLNLGTDTVEAANMQKHLENMVGLLTQIAQSDGIRGVPPSFGGNSERKD